MEVAEIDVQFCITNIQSVMFDDIQRVFVCLGLSDDLRCVYCFGSGTIDILTPQRRHVKANWPLKPEH